MSEQFKKAFTDKEENKYIQRIKEYIIIGEYIRPWKNYGLRFSVLNWLQYLTQVTLEKDMGSICGVTEDPGDCSFIYRFFIWIAPNNLFKINKIAIELCDDNGKNLFVPEVKNKKSKSDEDYHRADNETLLSEIQKSDIELFSLKQALKEFKLTPNSFWDIRGYEYPPLVQN